MTSICLSAPLFLILRRLFNVFSAFSISHSYLSSRWMAKIQARASKAPCEEHRSNEAGEMDKDGGTLAEQEKNKQLPQDSPTNESSWNVLNRLKRALPAKEQGADAVHEPERDTVAELRRRHLQDLATRPAHPPGPVSPIHRLISNPQLFNPVRAPRHPIVLCHGLYGFDVRGPEAFPKLRMHYWSNVLHVLRKKVGATVVVTGVPGTGSIASRAERMDRFLKENVPGKDINFLAHSMGGLDCRHLITHIQPQEYRPMSLTSLSVPHRGSPFMDWCLANIGIGSPRPFPFPATSPTNAKSTTCDDRSSSPPTFANHLPYSLRAPLLSRPPATQDGTASFTLSMLPSSLTATVLSLIDSPAQGGQVDPPIALFAELHVLTRIAIDVKYFSVAARTSQMSIWHPLWLPKLIVDAAEEQEAYSAHGGDVVASESRPPSPHVALSHGPDAAGAAGDPHSPRGNDGLVTISSARWGTFLGIIEGCDHWELRGARGLGAEWEEGWGACGGSGLGSGGRAVPGRRMACGRSWDRERSLQNRTRRLG
ncbi:Alpha/Beta hydrolase protein [Hysterangium stoloniferum]|nr:Alpha/Beta hydrolase protein [Hysterangium stoloniferum]